MSQNLDELEQRIGYRFHNRDHLRRALTCQSAINEGHQDATEQNFQALEFVGDAALKYAIATLLYIERSGLGSVGQLHDRVVPLTTNSYICSLGKELNLNQYIIKGRGVSDPTDKMIADAVKAILGAIVIDQQHQGNSSENVLFDVVARLWSIKRNGRSLLLQNNDNNKKCSCCDCCSCWCWIIVILIFSVILSIFIFKKFYH
jgi:dsRNA-specific ribonuclease